jgi:hypothetical protein
MHDALAWGWRGPVNQVRMQRWLPIVDAPFGDNADEIIGL